MFIQNALIIELNRYHRKIKKNCTSYLPWQKYWSSATISQFGFSPKSQPHPTPVHHRNVALAKL